MSAAFHYYLSMPALVLAVNSRRRLVFLAAAMALTLSIAVLAGCNRGGQGAGSAGAPASAGGPPKMPPMPVEVATVERGGMPITINAVGSFQSQETTTVAADVAGLIVFLDTPEGRVVEKGHVLARLDQQVSEATLQVAVAREKNAAAELARVEPLVEDGVVPRSALDDATAELEVARRAAQRSAHPPRQERGQGALRRSALAPDRADGPVRVVG